MAHLKIKYGTLIQNELAQKEINDGTFLIHFSFFSYKEYYFICYLNMAFKVYFEDGKGNAMDEDGLEPVQMEVDEEAYPLDDITNYDSHKNP